MKTNFSKETEMANRYMKKMVNITNQQKNANEYNNEILVW